MVVFFAQYYDACVYIHDVWIKEVVPYVLIYDVNQCMCVVELSAISLLGVI